MWNWFSVIEVGALLLAGVLLFNYGKAALKWLRLTPALRKRFKELPKGSLGWPVVGETLALQQCLMSTAPHSFVNERRRRYGNLFLTHLFGSAMLASTDSDMSKFILTKEEPLFAALLPKTLMAMVGSNALINLRSERHKRMRRLVMSVFSPDNLKYHSGRIHELATSMLKTWNDRKVIVHDETREFTFHVALTLMMEMDPPQASLFRSKFMVMRAGCRSLPLDLPGTNYRKAWQARKALKEMVEEEIFDRKQRKESSNVDLLDKLLQAHETDGGEPLTNDEIVDLILSSMLAGFDTSANTLLFLIYYIRQHPSVYQNLKMEHDEILKDKDPNELLSWNDYKRMKLTQMTINETLRLANPVLSLHRLTLKDFECDGHFFPANCHVQVWLRTIHTDPNVYPQPYNFDINRWKDKMNTNNFIPFGLGPRLCVGMELARMELCFFVHSLITMYSWEFIGDAVPILFPEHGMKEGMPIVVRQL